MVTQSDDQRGALRRALRRARKDSGMTQSEVAALLSMPQSFVSKYEAGQRRLDLVELLALCAALRTDLQSLLLLFETELTKDKKNEA